MEPLYATIIILVVTSRNITLAADSRKTILSDDNVCGSGVMDKIYQTDDYFYAVSGVDSSVDRSFSIHALVHNILTNTGDFDQVAKRLANDLTYKLKGFFTNMKEFNADLFQRFQKYSASGGEIVIIKNVDNVPTCYLLEYKVSANTNVNVIVHTWRTDCKIVKEQNHCFWRTIGNTAFMNSFSVSEQEIASNPDLFAKKIIQEGIKRYPAFVSEPMNILQLDESGAQWKERSATAPNRIHH
jgi:hypothetical protein